MYNDLEVGSYLTWQGWPRHRVFQDPRINGYPHDVARRPEARRSVAARVARATRRFGVDTALVTYPGRQPARRAVRSERAGRWSTATADGLVFVRATPLVRRADRPRRDTARVHVHAAPAASARARCTSAPPSPQVTACEWRRRLGDLLVELGDDAGAARRIPGGARRARSAWTRAAHQAAGLALGDVALRLRDPATAAEAYEGIALPRARRNRGLALLALGKPQRP